MDLYLKEEIQAQALVRSLPNFSRFLKLAALASSEQINYANIASDVAYLLKPSRNITKSYRTLSSDLNSPFGNQEGSVKHLPPPNTLFLI